MPWMLIIPPPAWGYRIEEGEEELFPDTSSQHDDSSLEEEEDEGEEEEVEEGEEAEEEAEEEVEMKDEVTKIGLKEKEENG